MADGDEILQVADFKIAKPAYSDSEDFELGAHLDREQAALTNDFKQKFVETMKVVSRKFSVRRLYLFTAKNISNLAHLLPKNWKNMIGGHLKGDYTKFHPFQILEKVQNLQRPKLDVQAGIA